MRLMEVASTRVKITGIMGLGQAGGLGVEVPTSRAHVSVLTLLSSTEFSRITPPKKTSVDESRSWAMYFHAFRSTINNFPTPP